MQVRPKQHQKSTLYILIYSTAENWGKYCTRYKKKGAGTEMHKCLVRLLKNEKEIFKYEKEKIEKKWEVKLKKNSLKEGIIISLHQ